jgi:hypothetical protein
MSAIINFSSYIEHHINNHQSCNHQSTIKKNMQPAFPLLFSAIVGFTHALEADHLLAVSNMVTRRTSLKLAVRDGIAWGLGHTFHHCAHRGADDCAAGGHHGGRVPLVRGSSGADAAGAGRLAALQSIETQAFAPKPYTARPQQRP